MRRDGIDIEHKWATWRAKVDRRFVEARPRNPLPVVASDIRRLLTIQPEAAGKAGALLDSEWRPLGLRVLERRMRSAGACTDYGGRRLVYVRRGDMPARQRFTVAHEVGHLLLDGGDSVRAAPPSHYRVERWCDDFAQHLLAPSDVVAAVCTAFSHEDDLVLAIRVARALRVTLSVALRGLAPRLADGHHVIMAVDRRGHRNRPNDIAYRVFCSAGTRGTYVPKMTRLKSIGLHHLDREASVMPHALTWSGRDENVAVTVRSSETGRWEQVVGSVSWESRVLDIRHTKLIVSLDVSELVSCRR